MANIKHYFREESVYEECNDRGVRFKDWVRKTVEHYACSSCGAEVDKNSAFCHKCGEKLNGIKEETKKLTCVICGTKEKVLSNNTDTCCSRCNRLLKGYDRIEIAKAFYELGKKQ